MRAPPTDQTVVVENRPGANGGIAINVLICSPANSQTFVVTALSMLRELQLAAGSRLPGGRVNVPVAAPWYGPLSAGRPGGDGEPHDIPPRIPVVRGAVAARRRRSSNRHIGFYRSNRRFHVRV